MRRPIQLTQVDVENYADQAAALSEWLEEKASSVTSRVVIPAELTTVAPVVIVSGLFILIGSPSPSNVCWGGCIL